MNPLRRLYSYHRHAPALALVGIGFVLLFVPGWAAKVLGLIAIAGGFYAVVGRSILSFIADRSWNAAISGDGYALPISISDSRGLKRLERWGGVLSVDRTGSILALGATRSGKTEASKWIVSQQETSSAEPKVIYDHKDDWQQYLQQQGQPYIRLSAEDSTHHWNLFLELEDESDADEIARAIFPDNPENYFDDVAPQVFAAIIKYLDREGRKADEVPTNQDLVRYVRERPKEDIFEALNTYPDLSGAASHLDPSAEGQANGVYGSLQRTVTKVFKGDFAKEGAFSIRDYMENPQGYALVLDYPQRQGESTKPMFRLLIDLAAREALSDKERESYFILDEIAQLPNLRRLDELVNVGAGQAIQVLATIQSVSQLKDNYGRDAADAIMAGFRSKLIMRCGDKSSIEAARTAVGKEQHERTSHVDKSSIGGHSVTQNRETKIVEEHAISESELSKFNPGEGIVIRPDSWAKGRVPMLSGN
jgi:type IV secretory pathway TraG/TraD family ATPase VirD4